MDIQYNTDKTISGEERQEVFFTAQIAKDLDRFNNHITRIEVHLKDENGKKEGIKDIQCTLEARLEGRKPIAATHNGANVKQAVTGATTKIKAALDTVIGKSREH
jgi:ribosome-associated translation inhibitor RaiA|tara:strand:+ start:1599 stop:1913 length:315 start_codon:yes stop_codon:yes gene_type:complete